MIDGDGGGDGDGRRIAEVGGEGIGLLLRRAAGRDDICVSVSALVGRRGSVVGEGPHRRSGGEPRRRKKGELPQIYSEDVCVMSMEDNGYIYIRRS